MEQHIVPRQITTFEFKLIGFLTLKQFFYLIIFLSSAYLLYIIIPLPLIKELVAFSVASCGLALAFVPIQDRPLDIWIKNIWKRLTSPTQYIYRKTIPNVSLLDDIYIDSDPRITSYHRTAKKYLDNYTASKAAKDAIMQDSATDRLDKIVEMIGSHAVLNTTSKTEKPITTQMQNTKNTDEIDTAVIQKTIPIAAQQIVSKSESIKKEDNANEVIQDGIGLPFINGKKPTFMGVVKDIHNVVLKDMLVYIKKQDETVVKLLKTNVKGIFATFTPLEKGSYIIEIKDKNNVHNFDTMLVSINADYEYIREFYEK
jgi:hypothetical protein